MRTDVNHEVMFFLDDSEGPVLPGYGHNAYIHVDGITVHITDGREPNVWGGGYRCKKDGTLGKGWGKSYSSAKLPIEDWDYWIAKAEHAIIDKVFFAHLRPAGTEPR